MRGKIRLLFVVLLFSAALPAIAWGYVLPDRYGDRSAFPCPGSLEGHRHRGALRLRTGEARDGYYVYVCLDGLHPDDIQVYIRHNRLVLQVAQGDRHGLYQTDVRGVSQWKMRVRRQLRLPYDADANRMTTTMKNDVIEIYIPRREQYQPGGPSFETQ